jgi:hypothetical protein
MVFIEFSFFRISKSRVSEVLRRSAIKVIRFLFLYIKSAGALKKRQIVKDPGISTNLKNLPGQKLLGLKRRHVWRKEYIW